MEEESESDAFAWNKGGNVRGAAQVDFHGQSWSGGSACHFEHEGDAAAKAAIDLNDPEAVRRELDLCVKAADLDADGEHRGGRKIQNPGSLVWRDVGGYEEPGLPERRCKGKPAGYREVLDGSVADHALDRQVVGEILAKAGSGVGEILLQHHVGSVTVKQRSKRAEELVGIIDTNGGSAVRPVHRLEHRREPHALRDLL